MSDKKALVAIIRSDSEKKEYMLPLPNPTTYSSTNTTMVDSGTSVSGKMLGSVVRENVAKISLSWNYLSTEEWKYINEMFITDDKSGDSIINKVRFFNQATGDWDDEDKEMYVSDRSAGMWRYDDNGTVMGWTGCSLELTEV